MGLIDGLNLPEPSQLTQDAQEFGVSIGQRAPKQMSKLIQSYAEQYEYIDKNCKEYDGLASVNASLINVYSPIFEKDAEFTNWFQDVYFPAHVEVELESLTEQNKWVKSIRQAGRSGKHLVIDFKPHGFYGIHESSYSSMSDALADVTNLIDFCDNVISTITDVENGVDHFRKTYKTFVAEAYADYKSESIDQSSEPVQEDDLADTEE